MQTRDPRVLALFTAYGLFTSSAAIGHLPPSLEQSPLLGQLSAIGIVAGSVLIVGGILWRDRDDGLLVEQVGNFLASFGSFFYGMALFLSSTTFTNSAIVLGALWGITIGCAMRFVQIQRYVHRRKRRTEGATP
jgi:hypothetical protein